MHLGIYAPWYHPTSSIVVIIHFKLLNCQPVHLCWWSQRWSPNTDALFAILACQQSSLYLLLTPSTSLLSANYGCINVNKHANCAHVNIPNRWIWMWHFLYQDLFYLVDMHGNKSILCIWKCNWFYIFYGPSTYGLEALYFDVSCLLVGACLDLDSLSHKNSKTHGGIFFNLVEVVLMMTYLYFVTNCHLWVWRCVFISVD